METKSQYDDTDSTSDDVGLVVHHVLSADVTNKLTGTNWVIDSGATCHICNDRGSFIEFKSLQNPLDILGDGRGLKAIGCRTVILILKSGPLMRRCKLYNVLYVPELAHNLLSVSKAVEKGISFTLNDHGCIIKDANRRLITVATKVGNLYIVANAKLEDYVYSVTKKLPGHDKEDLWHQRYGHLGVKNLQKLAKDNLVEEFDYCVSKETLFCEPCLKGKHQRSQFPPYSERRISEPLKLVHSDVCSKLSSKSLSGAEYFVKFIDDKTRYIWVYVINKEM